MIGDGADQRDSGGRYNGAGVGWPGDLAIAKGQVNVQEPNAAPCLVRLSGAFATFKREKSHNSMTVLMN